MIDDKEMIDMIRESRKEITGFLIELYKETEDED